MRERPILFNGPMVRAILGGTKGQTRRPVRMPEGWPGDGPMRPTSVAMVQASEGTCAWLVQRDADEIGSTQTGVRCPFGAPGDRLWVRETLKRGAWGDADDAVFYAADDAPAWDVTRPCVWPWKRPVLPSIHCPRGLSRLTLEVTGVRVERLQDITEADALAEGVVQVPSGGYVVRGTAQDACGLCHTSPVTAFSIAWDDAYGEGDHAWEHNPWVWVVEFRRVTP